MFDETTTFQISHAQVGADELFGIQVPESQRANTMFPVRTGALDGVPEIDMMTQRDKRATPARVGRTF